MIGSDVTDKRSDRQNDKKISINHISKTKRN